MNEQSSTLASIATPLRCKLIINFCERRQNKPILSTKSFQSRHQYRFLLLPFSTLSHASLSIAYLSITKYDLFTLPKHGHGALTFVVRSQQISRDIRQILCGGGEKLGKIKIVSSSSAIKLRFVINVLKNKTIIMLNLVEYPLILANAAYSFVD